jgi:hypothetical protein
MSEYRIGGQVPSRKTPEDVENSAPEPTGDEPTAETAEKEPTNIVRYIGLVSERRISKEDWEQAGVSGQDGATWTKDTNSVVPIDHFSEEALRVLANTGEFEIIRDVKD